MRVRDVTVSRAEVAYSCLVLATATVALLPDRQNTVAYLVLMVITFPVAMVAIPVFLVVLGSSSSFSDSIGWRLFAIIVWVALAATQMRMLVVFRRDFRRRRGERIPYSNK